MLGERWRGDHHHQWCDDAIIAVVGFVVVGGLM
jgi:hypothetical protein